MKNTIISEQTVVVNQEEIPIVWRGDVLVAGGGPAGLGAAIASHRKGDKTILLEQYGFLGGMCSYGAGMPLGGAYPGLRTIGGIAEEILTLVRNAGKDAADVRHMPLFGDWYFHDSEYFKSMIAGVVLKEKMEVRLHCFVSDVIMDGRRKVAGVIVDSKSGRQAYMAKTIIDATGDADICARAGARFEKGDENGAMMGVTLVFNMGGVDTEAYSAYLETDPRLEKALLKAELEGDAVNRDDKYTSIHLGMRPNSLFMNSVRVRNIDGTKVEDLTRAELEGRVRVMQQVEFFRKYIPGCEKAYIMNSGAQIGVRDTRRIVGEDYLSKEDCLELVKRPETVILRCTGPFDNTTRGNEREYVLNQIDMEQWYDIPYGCIVPLDLDNVVVAGRTFSCHFLALTSSRGQALLIGLGQAAGTAAHLASVQSKRFKDIDVKELQNILKEDGCDLGC